MRNLTKIVSAAPLLMLNRIFRAQSSGLRILMFHDVPASQRFAFERLIAGLANSGSLVSPLEAERRLQGASSPASRAAVLLTFDDGFSSNIEVAEKILESYGAKAIYFVCPGLINTPADRQTRRRCRGHLRSKAHRRESALKPPAHGLGST